jgi:sulfur relay protein TusB/DsrH
MLHIVSASPYQNFALRECLAVAQVGDAIVLLADAVYAAQMEPATFAGLGIFALSEHLQARGIESPEWIQPLDYDGMVQLTCQHHPVQTWS